MISPTEPSDPRYDPRPGDIVSNIRRGHERRYRLVQLVEDDGRIFYLQSMRPDYWEHCIVRVCWLHNWSRRCDSGRGASIYARGDHE